MFLLMSFLLKIVKLLIENYEPNCHQENIDDLAQIFKFTYALEVIAPNISIEAAMVAYHAYAHSRIRYSIIF